MPKLKDKDGNFIGFSGMRLVPKLTEEEKEWVRTATYEQWVEKHGQLSADIAFSDVTHLYKRKYA